MSFRFIPFGESKENLAICLKYHTIGIRRKTNIDKDEILYLTLKKNGVWYVCGKAKYLDETEDAPFENPERYYTYSVTDLVVCEPYGVSEVLRDNLGNYWGLIFQSPRVIENSIVEGYIEQNFIKTSNEKMLEMINGK